MKTKTKTNYKVDAFQAGIDNPEEIAAIHLSIREWQIKIGQSSFPDPESSQTDLKTLDQFYIKNGGNFFIAKDTDGKIIGFVGLKKEGEVGVFKRLAVVPEKQRQGIAKTLVAEAIDWARKNGFTKLSLRTGITENAQPLYEQFGFKVIRFNDGPRDLLMETDLK